MITEYQLTERNRQITVRIIRSARKSMGLEVKEGGQVLARIPERLPDRELVRFLEEHKGWMADKLAQAEERAGSRETVNATPVRKLTSTEKVRIARKITARVQYYSRLMGVSVGRITIRNQKTRWGSCSSKGNLNFNYQLYYLPDELLDYVVVHELAHRRHMNHSAQFWQEVERYFPDWRACRERLKGVRLEG